MKAKPAPLKEIAIEQNQSPGGWFLEITTASNDASFWIEENLPSFGSLHGSASALYPGAAGRRKFGTYTLFIDPNWDVDAIVCYIESYNDKGECK